MKTLRPCFPVGTIRYVAFLTLVVASVFGDPPDQIYWGSKVSPEFKNKVIQIAGQLNTDPSYLMTVMSIETSKIVNGKPEPTFDPSIQNPGSSAVGLIQFTAATAAKLGTTTDKLKAMSAVEQLDWVKKYFEPQKDKLTSVEDTYLAVFYPALIGKPDSDTLPDAYYEPNKGLDKDNDGKITRGEIVAYVKKRHAVGAGFKG
jgi:hypothetical protein